MTEEQNLDGNCQPGLQEHDSDQQDLADLLLGGADDGEEILDQEIHADGVAHADERVVEAVERRPRHQSNGDPEQIRVSVQRPALDQLERLRTKPAQRGPQPQRHEQRVPVDQARRAAEQGKVVLEVFLSLGGQFVADGPRQEQNHHDGRGDPEGPVQVGVAVHDVEERWCVGDEGQDGRPAPVQHRRGVDVEVLRVERQRPEHVLLR